MRHSIGLALLASALGAGSACSYNPDLVDDSDVVLYEYRAVREMQPQGPAFNQGLRTGYLDYGDVLYADYDMVDFGQIRGRDELHERQRHPKPSGPQHGTRQISFPLADRDAADDVRHGSGSRPGR
jgi:hypothetical protein